MSLGDRFVMCTHCPTPCQSCGDGGPFCEETPCDCSCHSRKASAAPTIALDEVIAELDAIRGRLADVETERNMLRALQLRAKAKRVDPGCECWTPDRHAGFCPASDRRFDEHDSNATLGLTDQNVRF